MRSFKTILAESKKVYSFKIGIAGELPENVEGKLKTYLEKFTVVKLSKGKTTPIQERPLDFPQIKNSEVTYYEVDLHYPTTSQVLSEYLSQSCAVPASHIIVRNTNDPIEIQQDETSKEEKVYEPLLTKEDMGGECAQDQVGGSRVMELLKELEAARKEQKAETGS